MLRRWKELLVRNAGVIFCCFSGPILAEPAELGVRQSRARNPARADARWFQAQQRGPAEPASGRIYEKLPVGAPLDSEVRQAEGKAAVPAQRRQPVHPAGVWPDRTG